MSDFGRKDFSTKAKEGMTPDSSKSTQQKVKETFTGTTDKIARGGVPDSEKSTSQKLQDKTSRTSDREVHGGTAQSIGDKVKGALGMDKHH